MSGGLGTVRLASTGSGPVTSLGGARVSNATNQAIPTATYTKASWDTEEYDTGAMHDGVNKTRLTAPVAGIYGVSYCAAWANNGAGIRATFVGINNTFPADPSIQTVRSASSAGPSADAAAGYFHLDAGDYVELLVYQDTGGDLNLLAAGSYFAMQLITRDP